ncbi:hypothetical protein CVT26_012114 [Gymnopilus dilepis]|uniref:DUF6532 domain-containing protein n=1 Tax=Gymnopilus dilepis TaxID=231916 RepID=A0A409YGK8_9AGAR|nr:hypothetical protein CVT26_012114 [Gymnopilus dilepis]
MDTAGLTHLIGTRIAKKKALEESHWYEATGTKRPRSPVGNKPAQGGERAREQVGGTKEKRQKRGKEDEGGDGGGKEARNKTGSKGAKVNKDIGGEAVRQAAAYQRSPRFDLAFVLASNNSTSAKRTTAKAQKTAIDSESESELPSEPEEDNNRASASSGEDELEDEDDDVAGMTQKEFLQTLDNEAPRDPATLFDDDDDIEMASVHSGSRRSSSGVSRPPTSESEGPGFEDPEESDEEEKTEAVAPKQKEQAAKRPTTTQSRAVSKPSTSKNPKTASATRTPRISTVRIESDTEDTTAKPTWPEHAHLNLAGALRVQNDFIRAICRDAIKIVEKTLITEQAWPELHQTAMYRRQVLAEATRRLLEKDKQYKVLLKRIMKDDSFVKTIGKWVTDRLSHHRGTIRGTASGFIAVFQLGVGDACKERVLALMDKDVYIYAGEWGTTEDGKPIWLTKRSSTEVFIYLNPGLIDLLHYSCFATSGGLGWKFKEFYTSSHPTQSEPELTIPLVALGATALYAAISEWRDGKKIMKVSKSKAETAVLRSAEQFDGDVFKMVFDRHVGTLTELKQKAPNTFHSVMSRLYTEVTRGNTSAELGDQSGGTALSILDLAGLT